MRTIDRSRTKRTPHVARGQAQPAESAVRKIRNKYVPYYAIRYVPFPGTLKAPPGGRGGREGTGWGGGSLRARLVGENPEGSEPNRVSRR